MSASPVSPNESCWGPASLEMTKLLRMNNVKAKRYTGKTNEKKQQVKDIDFDMVRKMAADGLGLQEIHATIVKTTNRPLKRNERAFIDEQIAFHKDERLRREEERRQNIQRLAADNEATLVAQFPAPLLPEVRRYHTNKLDVFF